jgi:hypothetical protein
MKIEVPIPFRGALRALSEKLSSPSGEWNEDSGVPTKAPILCIFANRESREAPMTLRLHAHCRPHLKPYKQGYYQD